MTDLIKIQKELDVTKKQNQQLIGTLNFARTEKDVFQKTIADLMNQMVSLRTQLSLNDMRFKQIEEENTKAVELASKKANSEALPEKINKKGRKPNGEKNG